MVDDRAAGEEALHRGLVGDVERAGLHAMADGLGSGSELCRVARGDGDFRTGVGGGTGDGLAHAGTAADHQHALVLKCGHGAFRDQNAAMPVMARPRIRAWMSCVPS